MKIKLTETDINGKPIESTEININITKKDVIEYGKLFCKCHYLEKNQDSRPEYVENYNGVSHGWICPNCKKFVQIG